MEEEKIKGNLTELWQRIVTLENDFKNLQDEILKKFTDIQTQVDHNRNDLEWFNQHKLPAMAEDIDERFQEVKKEILTEVNQPQKSKWKALFLRK